MQTLMPCSQTHSHFTVAGLRSTNPFLDQAHLLALPLLISRLANIQAQPFSIQIDLIAASLQDRGNVLGVLELSQIDI